MELQRRVFLKRGLVWFYKEKDNKEKCKAPKIFRRNHIYNKIKLNQYYT